MKNLVIALAAALALALTACMSTDVAKVNSADIASSSDAVAIVQATQFGFAIIFSFVPIAESTLDETVNKTLVAEAKAMGGNKVEIIDMMGIHPDQFPMSLSLVNPSIMMATGLAVK
jgi:outer membrane lipoprotein SlyB